MKKVYDCGGEYLGNEWVDLSGLQEDTRKAILQMIYLDETVQKCLSMGDSDAVSNFNYGSGV